MQQWKKPQPGKYKINFDTTIDVIAGVTSLGVVIRDHEGDFIACFMKKLQGAMDSKHAEALALKWVVRWTKKIGLVGGCFESDCLEVIRAVKMQTLEP